MKKDFLLIPAWTIILGYFTFAVHYTLGMFFDFSIWIDYFCIVLAWAEYIFIGLYLRKNISTVTAIISTAVLCVLTVLNLLLPYHFMLDGACFIFVDMSMDFIRYYAGVPYRIDKIIDFISALLPLGFMLFLIKRKTPQTVEIPANVTK